MANPVTNEPRPTCPEESTRCVPVNVLKDVNKDVNNDVNPDGGGHLDESSTSPFSGFGIKAIVLGSTTRRQLVLGDADTGPRPITQHI